MPISGPDSRSRNEMGENPRMLKLVVLELVVGVLCLAFVIAPAAVAQQGIVRKSTNRRPLTSFFGPARSHFTTSGLSTARTPTGPTAGG